MSPTGARRRPRPTSALLLGAMLVAVAACSGSGGLDPGSATAEATVPKAEVGGDQGGDRTLDVAASPPVTRPVVSIPNRWPSDIEELYGRYWLYWEAFVAAHGPPNADPSYAPLQELSTADNWASLQDQLRDFADDGLVLVAPRNSVSEHLIRLPNASVTAKEEGAEIVLQDCWIDDLVQQTVDGQVVVEATEAKLMNVSMRVVDGQWRVDGISRATPESDGYEECEALVS